MRSIHPVHACSAALIGIELTPVRKLNRLAPLLVPRPRLTVHILLQLNILLSQILDRVLLRPKVRRVHLLRFYVLIIKIFDFHRWFNHLLRAAE